MRCKSYTRLHLPIVGGTGQFCRAECASLNESYVPRAVHHHAHWIWLCYGEFGQRDTDRRYRREGMYAAMSGVLFLGLGLVLSLGKLLRIFRRWLFTSLNGRVTITASL